MDQATLVGVGIGVVIAIAVIGGFASRAPSVSAPELAAWLESAEPPVVVDTRSRGDFRDGHVPGAVHVPLAEAFGTDRISPGPDQRVVLCAESPFAARLAKLALGFSGISNLHYLEGSFEAWEAEGHPVRREADAGEER